NAPSTRAAIASGGRTDPTGSPSGSSTVRPSGNRRLGMAAMISGGPARSARVQLSQPIPSPSPSNPWGSGGSTSKSWYGTSAQSRSGGGGGMHTVGYEGSQLPPPPPVPPPPPDPEPPPSPGSYRGVFGGRRRTSTPLSRYRMAQMGWISFQPWFESKTHVPNKATRSPTAGTVRDCLGMICVTTATRWLRLSLV